MHLNNSLQISQINHPRSTCTTAAPSPTNCTTAASSSKPVPQLPPPPQPAPANPAGWPQPFPHQPVPQIIHQQMVNWSHFKPEFAGKPEEDAEAHLLCSNDWMRTHNFNEEDKVKRFCLTLLGEARLWYETLTPIANDWPALQNAFR